MTKVKGKKQRPALVSDLARSIWPRQILWPSAAAFLEPPYGTLHRGFELLFAVIRDGPVITAVLAVLAGSPVA